MAVEHFETRSKTYSVLDTGRFFTVTGKIINSQLFLQLGMEHYNPSETMEYWLQSNFYWLTLCATGYAAF